MDIMNIIIIMVILDDPYKQNRDILWRHCLWLKDNLHNTMATCDSGNILSMSSADKRRGYDVTPSFIGLTHTQNSLCD